MNLEENNYGPGIQKHKTDVYRKIITAECETGNHGGLGSKCIS